MTFPLLRVSILASLSLFVISFQVQNLAVRWLAPRHKAAQRIQDWFNSHNVHGVWRQVQREVRGGLREILEDYQNECATGSNNSATSSVVLRRGASVEAFNEQTGEWVQGHVRQKHKSASVPLYICMCV